MDEIEAALHVLGLGIDANGVEIDRAYRDLAMVWHPDRFPSDSRIRYKAEEKFKSITGAYEVLKRSDRQPRSRQSASETARTQSQQSTSTADPAKSEDTRSQSKSSSTDGPARPRGHFGYPVRRPIYVVGALLAGISVAYFLYHSSNAHRHANRNAPTFQSNDRSTPSVATITDADAPGSAWQPVPDANALNSGTVERYGAVKSVWQPMPKSKTQNIAGGLSTPKSVWQSTPDADALNNATVEGYVAVKRVWQPPPMRRFQKSSGDQ